MRLATTCGVIDAVRVEGVDRAIGREFARGTTTLSMINLSHPGAARCSLFARCTLRMADDRVASDQIAIVRLDHRFETGVHAEAAQYRADVVTNGVDRHAELVGHLFGGAAARE